MRAVLRHCFLLVLLSAGFAPFAKAQSESVIFFHPDGAAANHWGALRVFKVGPDGELNWDKLPAMALYKGHLKDSLTSTSHGGATVHAYGVKVATDSFGLDGTEPITAASGKRLSIMQEAKQAGKAIGLIQTGHIAEPGTAAFVASVRSRRERDAIAEQVIASGAQVIMSGGERYLLPKGVTGRHGEGSRKDGLNLINRAKELGYSVVYSRAELTALDLDKTEKVLGVFARYHTFSDKPEQINRLEDIPDYKPTAPTIAEMARVALKILSRSPRGFLLVAEEEGTDNMANANNAAGELEALARADEAIAVFHGFVQRNRKTLLLIAADSDAGGMQVVGPGPWRGRSGAKAVAKIGGFDLKADKQLPPTDFNGAPLDGLNGTASKPFMSAPDRAGKRWPFAIAWAAQFDVSGAVLVRGAGYNSDRIAGTMDNTEIYNLMHATLFGAASSISD